MHYNNNLITTLVTTRDSVLRPIAKYYLNQRAKLRRSQRFVKAKHAVTEPRCQEVLLDSQKQKQLVSVSVSDRVKLSDHFVPEVTLLREASIGRKLTPNSLKNPADYSKDIAKDRQTHRQTAGHDKVRF
jgi:hypothetical protein